MNKKWKIAGINFDHMHMGDLLRMTYNHPDAEIVAISDQTPERMAKAVENFSIPADRVFNDYRKCIEEQKPDIILLCPSTARHAEWVEKVAPFNTHILLEKPFALNLEDADRIISAVAKTGKQLAINWPLRWYPVHVTAKRLIDEELIGEVVEVHYYDGNRGPLRHGADKIPVHEPEEKSKSWFYKKSEGGGSLLDYLGYGTTLGTWYHNGKSPIEVTTVIDQPKGLEVDEHSITVARYECGLSKFETRWGTFTDPWTLQPQPKCGFTIKGTKGTIGSYDFEKSVRVQTQDRPEGYDVPVDELKAPFRNPVEYFINCIENNQAVDGPLSASTCRIGQQIVDSAIASAEQKRTIPLVK